MSTPEVRPRASEVLSFFLIVLVKWQLTKYMTVNNSLLPTQNFYSGILYYKWCFYRDVYVQWQEKDRY